MTIPCRRLLVPVLAIPCWLALASGAAAQLAMTSADGANQVALRGALQIDFRTGLANGQTPFPSTFSLRRARIYVDATLYKWIAFRIVPDLVDGKVFLPDAYLEARFTPGLRVRVGKFKVPVGLERLQSGADIRFVERALPTLVAPNRDIGFEVLGDLASDCVSYAASITNGVADGTSADADSDNGKDVAGRVMVQPWSAAQATRRGTLAVGLAGTWGRATGMPASPGLSSFGVTGQETLFRFRSGTTTAAAVVADGTRARLSPQATYYRGRFGALAEYIRSSEQLALGSARTVFHARAWQVAGSWILTGEAASYRGVTPKRPIAPGSGHWGAVELAARYAVLDVDGRTFPVFADPDAAVRHAGAWGLALNWYWISGLKAVVDYEHTAFSGGAPGGNRRPQHLLLGRMQLWF